MNPKQKWRAFHQGRRTGLKHKLLWIKTNGVKGNYVYWLNPYPIQSELWHLWIQGWKEVR